MKTIHALLAQQLKQHGVSLDTIPQACVGLIETVSDTYHKFVDIFENMPTAIAVYQLEDLNDDQTLTLVALNQAAAKITGAEEQFLLEKSIDEIFPALPRWQNQQVLAEVARSGKEALLADTFLLEDDIANGVYYNSKVFPLPNHRVGIIFENNDVCQPAIEKGIFYEEALRKSEARNRAILNAIPDLVAVTNRDGIYLEVNSGRDFKAAISVSELVGKSVYDILPPDVAKLTIECIEQALLTGNTQIFETQTLVNGSLRDREARIVASGEDEAITIVRDITSSKQAQEALRRSEERLRTVISTAPVILFALDKQGIFTLSEGRGLEALGRKPGQVVGLSIYDLYSKSTELLNVIDRTLAGNEVIGITQLGGLVFDSRCSPIRDENGAVVGMTGVAIDITYRIQAMEALKESEERFERLSEASFEAIFITENRIILEVNSTCVQMFGYKDASELIGMDAIATCIAPADRELASLHNRLHYEQPYEIFCLRKDGTNFIGEVRGKMMPYQGRKVRVAAVRDISDSKQAEEAMRQLVQREELLNRLGKQIRNSLDLDTILETAVNEICNLLQVERCDFIWYRAHTNPPSWEVVKEGKIPNLPSGIGFCIPHTVFGELGEKLLNLETLLVHDSSAISDFVTRDFFGKRGPISIVSLPIQTQSGEIGALGCTRFVKQGSWSESEVELLQAVADQLAIAISQAELYEQSRIAAATAEDKAKQLEITLHKLKQTQTQLIQSEKMSSLGQMVAGVAHEINNPVSFIYGNVDPINAYSEDLLNLLHLYQQSFPEPGEKIAAAIEAIELDFLVEDLPKMLSSIKTGADRIHQIVISLRNFSRLDEAAKKAVNIHEGIDSTLMILRHRLKEMAGHPSIQIIKEYGDLPLVPCYAGQLNQVFMNLLSNAIDALEEFNTNRERGEIKQHPNQIIIRTEVKNQDWIAIRIIDNAGGIPEAVRGRIFDPFFTTKAPGKGTGLGLSITYQIVVERHGGSIECLSELGQGTEFWIEIPITK